MSIARQYLKPSLRPFTGLATSIRPPPASKPAFHRFSANTGATFIWHRAAVRTMATNIPKTMKAVSISKNGGTEVLDYKTDYAVPQLKDGQVLVKNEYAGVNYIDTYFRTGLYPAPSFPLVLGREASGTVVAVGSGETYGIKVGDRVAYLSTDTYAEYTAATALTSYVIPESIDFRTAGAALTQGLTAVTLIEESHKVHKGDWILLYAGAGGMGSLLCQVLKAVGARTIATASTPEKRELAKKHGADVVLENPDQFAGGHDAFIAKVKDLTGGDGVAAVFDGVGKSTFDVSLACVARKGSVVSFGNASGKPDPLDIQRLASGVRNVKVLRPTVFGYIVTRDEFMHYAKDLFAMLASGKLKIDVTKEYELKDAAQAHNDLEGRKTTGKLLLKL